MGQIERITEIVADVDRLAGAVNNIVDKYGATEAELIERAAVALRKHRNEVAKGRRLLAWYWRGRYNRLTARAAEMRTAREG